MVLPLKLSPISMLLFIFFLITVIPGYAEDSASTSNRSDFKLGIKVLGTLNVPLSTSDRVWSPFPSCGLKVSLPVGVDNVEIHGTAEYGLIKGYEDEDLEVKTGIIRLLVSYTLPLKSDKISVKPFLGIMDMMIHHNGEDILESVIDTEIFKNVENEFGASIGVEPEFNFNRFSVSLPIFYDILFSSPKIYQSLNTSLAIGIRF